MEIYFRFWPIFFGYLLIPKINPITVLNRQEARQGSIDHHSQLPAPATVQYTPPLCPPTGKLCRRARFPIRAF